ncbi:alpha/beta fold hydrolase [Mycolicibacterium neworleansense]|uniref:Alpha/beta hydrolase n=1 Tax=Mycolicibacterium neworleansense TaxID=146018 RepID=A0A0H5RIP4_9MYCO|nr:alpha/beta hydrolase [Mycolicibacterium neworleansense]MCV7361967.1 alpha/beta hydrolase [Mycolicibacterium neworleansense]CRZ13626.1 alpha/beta hydrolase [Mycolicibacterium neworleansense]
MSETRQNWVEHDGRRIAYAAYGPDSGVPALFIAGAGCGRRMTFGQRGLDEYGIRLISVDRPGIGGSDPDPGKDFDTVAADFAAVIDAVAGCPVPVVANSQGAPFGLALARTGRASGLVLASPIDDLGYPPVTALLTAPHRDFVTAIAADPDGAMHDLCGYTAAALFDMIMADYPASDGVVYDDPGFREMLRAALTDGFAQGPAGYARDTVLASSPWPAHLMEPGVDVDLLFGCDDAVHSPDLGITLAGRIPRARRTVVAGVGGALLWALPDLVLRRLGSWSAQRPG